MNITERVERYDEIVKYDEENNDMQRVLLSDEAQSEAVMRAEDENIYAGYSELWEDGFTCSDIEDEKEKEIIEEKMNSIYIEEFEKLIKEFLEEENMECYEDN